MGLWKYKCPLFRGVCSCEFHVFKEVAPRCFSSCWDSLRDTQIIGPYMIATSQLWVYFGVCCSFVRCVDRIRSHYFPCKTVESEQKQ